MSNLIDTDGNPIPTPKELIPPDQEKFSQALQNLIAMWVSIIGPYPTLGIIEVQKKLLADSFRAKAVEK